MNSELVRHIRRYPDIEWNFRKLSFHPNLTLDVLKEFSEERWDFYFGVSKNKNWNWGWVYEFPNKTWNWVYFSESPYFKWSWVYEFPNKSWNWDVLSGKSGIQQLKDFPDKSWNWEVLTMSHSIHISEMMKCPYYPWTIEKLFFTCIEEEEIDFLRMFRSHYDSDSWEDHTDRTTWSIIKKNLDLPWCVHNIRIDKFEEGDIKYLYNLKGWNMEYLSEILDIEIILQCQDLKWNYDAVSRNKTANYYRYPSVKWNMHAMNLDFEKARWMAACVIQRYWKRCVTDPSRGMCRKLLLCDMSSIESDICKH